MKTLGYLPIAAKYVSAVRTHYRRPLDGVTGLPAAPGMARGEEEVYPGREVDVAVHDHQAIGPLQIAYNFVCYRIKDDCDGLSLGHGVFHAEVELPLLDVEFGLREGRRHPLCCHVIQCMCVITTLLTLSAVAPIRATTSIGSTNPGTFRAAPWAGLGPISTRMTSPFFALMAQT